MNLQHGNLPKLMTQDGKEMMERRWRHMLGTLDVRESLDQS